MPLSGIWSAVNPAQPSGPVFITRINGNVYPFTYGKFAAKLQYTPNIAGIILKNIRDIRFDGVEPHFLYDLGFLYH